MKQEITPPPTPNNLCGGGGSSVLILIWFRMNHSEHVVRITRYTDYNSVGKWKMWPNPEKKYPWLWLFREILVIRWKCSDVSGKHRVIYLRRRNLYTFLTSIYSVANNSKLWSRILWVMSAVACTSHSIWTEDFSRARGIWAQGAANRVW
jgi:hypothetical protein